MVRTTKLTLERQEAKDVIKHFLNSGNDCKFSPSTDPGLAEAEQKFHKWSFEAMLALDRSFTTSDVAEAFQSSPSQVKIPYIPDETEEQNRYRYLMNSYRQRVDFLKTIKGTLATYAVVPESKRDPQIIVAPAVPEDFEKLPTRWWLDHLPTPKLYKLLAALVALLLGAVILGVTIGQTTFIKQIVGKSVDTQVVPKLTSEEFKNRIDQLTQGHNARHLKLTEAIIDQQHGMVTYGHSPELTRQAIADLQKDIEKEDTTYESKLKTLQSLIASPNP